jgi:hypothetical protein
MGKMRASTEMIGTVAEMPQFRPSGRERVRVKSKSGSDQPVRCQSGQYRGQRDSNFCIDDRAACGICDGRLLRPDDLIAANPDTGCLDLPENPAAHLAPRRQRV